MVSAFRFFIVSIISTFYSNFPLECINDLRQMSTAFLFLALTLFFIREKQLKKTIPIILIVSTFFSAFVAVAGKIFRIDALFITMDSNALAGRVIGTANDPNFFCSNDSGKSTVNRTFYFHNGSKRNRILLAALFLHNCYAVVLTYSRGVILALCFTIIIILIEHFKRIKLKYLGFLIVATGILGSIAVSQLPEMTIWERMQTF